MGFFDLFNRGKQYDINAVKRYIDSLSEPEMTIQDMQTPAGIAEAFKKVDILQSIELTCKDYSKNHIIYQKDNQEKVLLNGLANTKNQTFAEVYSEIVSEKIKYRIAIARIYSGQFSKTQYIECLKLDECSINYAAVQYPTILDLTYIEYHNERIYPQDLLFFGNTSALVNRDYGKQGIEYAVSNLINDYEAKHNIISGRGAMGIISPANSSDPMGGISKMSLTERKELEKQLTKEYGVTKKKAQWLISQVPLSVQPTSMNVQELGISEDKKENITAICSHLKYPTDLYFANTTYDNQSVARAGVYNNILIPYAAEDAIVLSRWLKVDVEIDYSHVAELQDDEKSKVERNNQVVNYCSSAVQAGIMSIEEARKELNNYIDLEDGN
jgi:hypothetical protein